MRGRIKMENDYKEILKTTVGIVICLIIVLCIMVPVFGGVT